MEQGLKFLLFGRMDGVNVVLQLLQKWEKCKKLKEPVTVFNRDLALNESHAHFNLYVHIS